MKSDRDCTKSVVEKMISTHLVPHLASKITQIEASVKKSKGGFKNKLSRFFTKATAERNENDGIREGFKMNKSELELRNLIDISLVVQDYETVVHNAAYAIDDFKAIQALKHSVHCQEILMYARMAFDRNYLTTNFKEFVKDATQIFESYRLV